MFDIMKYTLIASMLFMGVMGGFAILDNAYERIDTICQEGC